MKNRIQSQAQELENKEKEIQDLIGKNQNFQRAFDESVK